MQTLLVLGGAGTVSGVANLSCGEATVFEFNALIEGAAYLRVPGSL